MSWRFLIAMTICATMVVGCDTGASYSDRSQGTATIQVGDSEFDGDADSLTTEVPIDEAIEIQFSRFLIVSTVTETNAYLKATTSELSASGSIAFDEGICNSENAVGSIVSYENQTIILAPRAELTCGTIYAICLTSDIKFEEDLNFEGRTIFFQSQSCVPALADNSPAILELDAAMTPVDFANTGGRPYTCSSSPSLPPGLSVSATNSTCRISGTPTTDGPTVTYTITGQNASGSDSATINIGILQAVPPDPVGLAVGSRTTTTIPMTWTSGGGTTVGYRLAVTAGASAPADCSSPTSTLGLVTSTSATGLSAGTEYSLRLCAINGNPTPDESPGARLLSQWTYAADPVISSAVPTATTMNLSWGAASGAAAYRTKRATGATAPADCSTPDFSPAATSQGYAGLTAGTQYSFRVCSANANPTPDISAGDTISAWTLPVEVSLGSASVSMTTITLSWGASSGALQYRIARAAGAVAPANCTLSDPSTVGTLYPDTGLTEGTQYSYRVCAENLNGDLTAGATTTVYTYAGEVTLGTVTTTTSDVDISWSAGAGATTYRIQRSAVSTPAAGCASPDYTIGGTSQTYTPLTAGSQQFFRICSVNSNNDVSSGTAFSTWLKPNIPATFTIATVATDGFTFNWTAGAGTNNGFRIKYAAGSTAPSDCNTGAQTSSYASGATSGSIPGLSPGQYSFRICSINGSSPADVGLGSTLSAWTLPAEAISFVGAAASATSISLTWNSTPGTNSGYILSRRDDGTNPPANCSSDVILGPTTATSLVDTPLSTGSHIYRLCTVNGNPSPDPSSGTVGTFWTSPPNVTGLTGTGLTTSTTQLSWTSTVGEQAGFVISRRSDGLTPVANCAANVVDTINDGSITSWTDSASPGGASIYRICAITGNPTIEYSSGQTGTFWPIPPTPIGFSVNSRAVGSTTFSFSNTVDSQSGYRLARATGSTPPANCNTAHETFAQNAISGTDDNSVTNGREYSYALCSTNSNPSPQESAVVTLTSVWSLPGDPSVSFANITDTTADVNWTANGDALQYHIQYDLASNGSIPVQCPVPQHTTAGLTQALAGLTASTAYYVRVCTESGGGDISSGDQEILTTNAMMMGFAASFASMAMAPSSLEVAPDDDGISLKSEDQKFVFDRDSKTGHLRFARREPLVDDSPRPQVASLLDELKRLMPTLQPQLAEPVSPDALLMKSDVDEKLLLVRQLRRSPRMKRLEAKSKDVRLLRYEPKRQIMISLQGSEMNAAYWDSKSNALKKVQSLTNGILNLDKTESLENLESASEAVFSRDGKNLYLLDADHGRILQFRILRDPLDVNRELR